MADIDNTGTPDAGDEASPPSVENAEAQTQASPRKKAAKKKATKKKVVAKKATKKKATKKKAVAKKRAPASTGGAAAAPAAMAPASMAASSAPPVWDDADHDGGMLGLLVTWGPVLLLIVLMLVLDGSTDAGSESVGRAIPAPAANVAGGSASSAVVQSVYQAGAIALPSDYEPWASDSASGDDLIPLEMQDSDDPGAFFWGAGDLDEYPPAPPGQ